MELRLVSLATDSFLLPDSGSLSLGYKCIWMYSYALALDCTGALVWGLAQFTDYVASFSASNPLARSKRGRLCSDLAEQLQLRFLNRILNLKPLSTIRWYARVCPVTIYTCSMEIRFKLPCRWLSTYTHFFAFQYEIVKYGHKAPRNLGCVHESKGLCWHLYH